MKQHLSAFYVVTAVLSLSMVSFHSAYAQLDGEVGIEGYVFNVGTGKPLANVLVTYEHVDQDTSATRGDQGLTDSNGFYQIDAPLTPPPRNAILFASCVTRRGNLRVDTSLFFPPRPTIYRRDFYIRMPRGISSCLP
jgi:hypothetical protein